MGQRKLRQIRLQAEYSELMRLSGNIIKIEPLGNAPYEKYRVTFNIRTVISPAPEFRDKTICILTIPSGYPDVAPMISVDSSSMP